MSGLDKIIEHITEEARTEADQILSAARAEAEKLISSGKEDTDAMTAAIVRQSESDVAAAVKRIQSAAALREKRILLQAKQDRIENVFQSALAYFQILDANAYFDVIRKMISKYADGNSGEIRFNQKDLDRLPADMEQIAAAKGLSVSRDAADISGGFILSYGDIEENCSFEALIETSREELQDKVGQLLFD